MRNEKFSIVICTAGKSPSLIDCTESLLDVTSNSPFTISLHLVVNGHSLDWAPDRRFKISIENKMGYSRVRNRALDEIVTDSNLIFLDDDELPTEQWLNSLIEMHFEYPDDIIIGPVYPQIGESFGVSSFRAKSYSQYGGVTDGSILKQGGSGNMLIPRSVIRSDFCYFDLFFNSGGEDTDFCFRARKNGTKIRFAEHAILFEVEDMKKRNPEYIQNRMIKDYVNYSLVIRRNSSVGVIVLRFIKLSVRLIGNSSYLMIDFKKAKPRLHATWESLKTLVTGNRTY